jgi:YHS domain-containing protein
MQKIILAVALAGAPVWAHGKAGHHAKKAEHLDAPASFEAQPPPGTWAKCPVSGEIFQVDGDTRFATYNGRVYAFCGSDCRPDFEKDPAKYAEKR